MQKRRFFSFRYVPEERRRGNRWGLFFLPAAIALFFLLSRCVFGIGRVTDVSMQPTLSEGRLVWINRAAYRFAPPRRGEIIVIHPPGKSRWLYIKRVVGLPGETLAVRNGRVVIDGRPLDEPYARGATAPEMAPMKVPEGSVFLLGDNRAESEDSRNFGPVRMERLIGKVR